MSPHMIALSIPSALGVCAIVVAVLQVRHERRRAKFWRSVANEIGDRFAYYIPDPKTGCWEWQRGKSSRGYGQLGRPKDSTVSRLAHRRIWESRRGPIPEGMALDHLCCNTSCVNPDHLEVVTPRENTLRWHARNPEESRTNWQRAQKARHAK